MKRNSQSNLLTGYLPSFLSTEPSFSFGATDNEFYCPLPTWCDSPPTGNGECAPCVPPSSASCRVFYQLNQLILLLQRTMNSIANI